MQAGEHSLELRIVAIMALAPTLTSADRAPSERVITGEGLVEVRVNEQPATLRIDPAAPAMPLINRSVAESAHLKMKSSWGVGIGYAIGNTSVMSRTQVVRLDLGNGRIKRRVGWTSRPFAAVADGSIGPEAFPETIIRFQLRDPRVGAKTVSFPMDRDSTALGIFGNFSATFGQINVGGEPMRVRFDPYHARSLVTAGAGARLARSYDGAITGQTEPTEIFFGVQRPVRTLILNRPLELGRLMISSLGIRTTDDGSINSIKEVGVPEQHVDPDEIVVTAKGKKRYTRRDTLSLGNDYLARCSSITFDRGEKVIRLTC